MNRYWFKRKKYGWGWTPATWQGWAITGGYLAVDLCFSFLLDQPNPEDKKVTQFLTPVLICTALLVFIAYKTGESPRWQWGEPKKDKKNNNLKK